MKVLKVLIYKNNDWVLEYFAGMEKGLILTTPNIEQAKKYKNAKGCAIAKFHIKKWGHDELVLSEDI